MNSTISPNMQLVIPTVGTEGSPQWAYDINSSLSLIDQHNHTSGNGVQIPPAGLDINTALPFQNNPATALSYLSFTAQASASSVIQSLSSAPTSNINELYYTDSNGTSTQITKNGVVNAIASSIPGESYSGGTFFWVQGSPSTTPANFDIGSITIRPNTASTTNGVVLGPPAGISSQYNVNLPLVPTGSTKIMAMDTSGNMSAPYTVDGTTLQISGNVISVSVIESGNIDTGAVGTPQLASSAVTDAKIASNTITIDKMATITPATANSGAFNITGSANVSMVSTTFASSAPTTRPLFVNYTGYIRIDATGGIGHVTFTLVDTTQSATLATWIVSNTTGGPIDYPASAWNWIGINATGSSGDTIAFKAQCDGGGITCSSTNIKLSILQV